MHYEHVSDFIEHLKTYDGPSAHHQKEKVGLTPSTINTYIYAIKAVFHKAWELGQVSDHELMRIQSFKALRNYLIPEGRALSKAETKALLESCQADSPEHTRDKAVDARQRHSPRRGNAYTDEKHRP